MPERLATARFQTFDDVLRALPGLLDAELDVLDYLQRPGVLRAELRDAGVFTDLGAWSPRGFTINGPQGPERAPGAMASASFFRVVNASPVVGRYFLRR